MIEIRQVSKSFGEQHILKQVSLDIAAGTRLCIVGKSGVGKSVLTKLVLGLLELDEGDIFIEGTSIRTFGKKEWQAVLKHFGVVFQGAALFDSLTVLENVGIRLFEEGQLSEDEIEGLVVQALARVHLPADILHKYPAELSGGMRKRVGISRAIIHEPRYLVYDEPTTGLDPVNSSAIDELMLELAERPGRTSIIITHDMFTVKQIASQVAMLHQGQLLFDGSAADFFASPLPEIQAFLARKLS